jgi:hypothetical protein
MSWKYSVSTIVAEAPMVNKSARFQIIVPLDASGIENFKPDRPIKVAVYNRSGGVAGSAAAQLDSKGKGEATLSFGEHPGGVRVVVGPADASDEDLGHLQTLSASVYPSQLKEGEPLRLTPIVISSFYWWWWGSWCREYTITGRLVCADGSPVPGATVCAYDVDWWWWWFSEDQLGCAVTGADGTFQMSFRRCCGWLWWWWWEQRAWRVNPILANRIVPLLQKIPGLRQVPLPDPAPDLGTFQSLLSQIGQSQHPAITRPQPKRSSASNSIDPGVLETLREQLSNRLPSSQELEALCVWPWCPWEPWLWDCDADIVFRATQNCQGQNTVILDETILQTRFDIPTELNVNLVANSNACCLVQPCQDRDCPPGNCILPIDICNSIASTVGGNPGASTAAATIGYANPGGATPGYPWGDQPFSEGIELSATFGDTFNGDYYEFEWTPTPAIAASWQPMPLVADGGFTRYYWDAALAPHSVPFGPTPINSPAGVRNVFESLQHYSANNSVGIGWDTPNYYTLMWWQTLNTGFSNGTYYLRLKAWTRAGYVGDLSNPRVVPFCDTKAERDNYLVITIDNRPTPGPGAGHPADHPCGGGTVHICTTEPDCNIFAVTIAGQSAGPCSVITAKDTDPVEIEFMVHDPDGMLAYYALSCNYGLDSVVDVICSNNGVPDAGAGVEIGSLAAGAAASYTTSWIGPAAQFGPDYGTALTQGATAPLWNGGTLKLATTVGEIFPEPCPSACAYQLQLWAYKRNIVECGDENLYYNLTELSLTVIKSEPCT